jgi:cytochrome c-type biogenesis protein CcmH
MTWFAAIASGMTLLALAFLLRPLLRRPDTVRGPTQDEANALLFRDQSAELEAELSRGDLAPELHAKARADLERRVLEELRSAPAPAAQAWPSARGLALAVALLLPLAATLLYLQFGNPQAIEQAKLPHGHGGITTAEVDRMVAQLAARMEANPEDAAGWALLARSYYALERFPEAVAAYAKAIRVKNDDAGLYADYADALAMTREPRFDDDVRALIGRALQIDPDHTKGLLLASTAAFARDDYRAAARHLERLQRRLPPDSELAPLVAERLAEARVMAGGRKEPVPPATAAASAASGLTVRGRVTLSAALASKAQPTDTVFILARAPEGSRMPVAILKRQVRDLPAEFTLGDEQAMNPALKLSALAEVVIVARISKSGLATPQSGDLLGSSPVVKVGASGIRLSIDSVVP